MKVLWFIITLLLRQQTQLDHRYRRFFLTWMLMGVVVSTSYSGVLFSFMRKPRETEKIETLVDVVEAQKFNRILPVAIENSPTIQMIRV